MANEIRQRQIGIGGLVEDNPLTAGATTLTSASLAAVTGGVDSSHHMAIVLDPDGVDGAPEIAYITALTNGAGSATVARGQEGTTARQHVKNTPWVHAPTPTGEADGSGGGMGLIGYTESTNATTYSTTSSTPSDVDATNLKVTFTAPPSGRVLVVMTALTDTSTGNYAGWGLRSGSSDVTGAQKRMLAVNNIEMVQNYRHVVTGLTAGTSYTYKWSFWSENGAMTHRIYSGGNGVSTSPSPIMEVWAVNL